MTSAASTFAFKSVSPGKYRLPLVTQQGDFALIVKKFQTLNPSVRGGAYKYHWVAYNGALNVKEHGDTRHEATVKALRFLATRNIFPVSSS